MEQAEDRIRVFKTSHKCDGDSSIKNGYHDNQDLTLSMSSLEISAVPESLYTVPASCLQELYLDYNDLEYLPEDLCNSLCCLVKLSLIGNKLITLPQQIANLNALRELYLNENELESLPDGLTELKLLTVLNIVGNNISQLPYEFGRLKCLEKFQADENQFQSLPLTIVLATSLQTVEICNNKLKHLPKYIGKLTKLKTFNASQNQLDDLPESFSELCNLEVIDLSDNGLILLPKSLKSQHCLKKLYVDNNNLETLPQWFGNLPEIVEISLKTNQLKEIPLPEEFAKVSKKLISLDLGGNYMSELPDSFGELESVIDLHLGSTMEPERSNFQNGNWLFRLPDSFAWLKTLRVLDLDENQLVALPENFGNLENLESVNISQNRLRDLPESFGNLKNLRVCILSLNLLEMLPSTIGNLQNLVDLRLDNNQIAELPESVSKLTQLKLLDLFNNKMKEIPECLPQLTNLTKLDIDENDFGLENADIPQILFHATYAPRNPELKDNWRGRPRQDLVDVEINKVLEPLSPEKDEIIQELEQERAQYCSNALSAAVRGNMSFWRTHGDTTGKRQKMVHPDMLGARTRLRHESQEESDDDEDDDSSESSYSSVKSGVEPFTTVDGENWDMEQYDPGVCLDVDSPQEDDVQTKQEENWDDEIEETANVATVPLDEAQRPFGGHSQNWKEHHLFVSENHFYLPSDSHVTDVKRYRRTNLAEQNIEQGQFEDLDEDDCS